MSMRLSAALSILCVSIGIVAYASAKDEKMPEIASLRQWNAKSYMQSKEMTIQKVFPYWAHFLDPNLRWQEIDLSFNDIGGTFEMFAAPFGLRIPRTTREPAQYIANNRWDIVGGAFIEDNPFAMGILPMVVNHAAGHLENNEIVFPTAFETSDLVYRVSAKPTPQFHAIARFHETPKGEGDIRISFLLSFDSGVERRSAEHGVLGNELLRTASGMAFRMLGAKGPRGIDLGESFIEDAAGRRESIMQEMRTTPQGEVLITKIVPRSFFTSAKFPVSVGIAASVFPDAIPLLPAQEQVIEIKNTMPDLMGVFDF